MEITQAIVLGIVQGLTEFLPISSSGHLVFLPKFFGWSDQGLAFDAILHLGTLLSVVVYFRKRLTDIFKSFFQKGSTAASHRRLGWMLVLSIIPAGIVGFFGEQWIETQLRSTFVIAMGLVFWGIILWFADRHAMIHKNKRDLKTLSWKQVVFISCAQAIALIPGTSRSGITMTAGLFSRLDKKAAAEFSFLMSVPIILIAGTLKFLDLFQTGFGSISPIVLFTGFIASALAGFAAIAGLLNIIQRWSFKPFVIYRIIIGTLILLLL